MHVETEVIGEKIWVELSNMIWWANAAVGQHVSPSACCSACLSTLPKLCMPLPPPPPILTPFSPKHRRVSYWRVQ
jgi:hypothetical protein